MVLRFRLMPRARLATARRPVRLVRLATGLRAASAARPQVARVAMVGLRAPLAVVHPVVVMAQ